MEPSVSTKEVRPVPLIEVRGLKTYFHTEDGIVRAVDGVDYVIEQEKT